MSRPRKRQRWNFQRFLRNVIILVVIAFVAYSVYGNLTQSGTDVYQVSYENIAITSQHRAIAMRDETVISTVNAGTFTPLIADGERVTKHQVVGQLKVEEATDDDADAVIAAIPIVDEQSLRDDVNTLYVELVNALRSRTFVQAKTLKRELDMKLDRLDKLIEANSDSAYQDSLLSLNRVVDQAATVGQVIDIPAAFAGILSYYFDGYESVVTYENRYKIDYESLFANDVTPSNQATAIVRPNKGIFKIVGSVSWHIACEVDIKDMGSFAKGTEVWVELRQQRLKGRIEDVFQAGDSGVMILEMLQYEDGLHKLRTFDITLMREEVRGIKLPSSAVVEQAGEPGVYSIDVNQTLHFTPIKILTQTSDFMVVQEGSFQIKDENDQFIRRYTLNHGDKIIVDAVNYREGDVID